MTDRFPLIANPTSKQIEELASGDNLNLQNKYDELKNSKKLEK